MQINNKSQIILLLDTRKCGRNRTGIARALRVGPAVQRWEAPQLGSLWTSSPPSASAVCADGGALRPFPQEELGASRARRGFLQGCHTYTTREFQSDKL